jgi:multidrug transporter EmrE-like cation transporter
MLGKTEGVVLSLLNLIVWGSWPSIRMKCKADGPVFAPLYFSGQFLSSLLFSLMIDGPKGFTGGMLQKCDFYRSILIVLAGFMVGNADFLCSCAMSHIPFSVAFPIYTGICLAMGTFLTWLVEGSSSQDGTAYLFAGVLFAICAGKLIQYGYIRVFKT